MKNILEPLFERRALSRRDARELLITLATADLPVAVQAASLAAFRTKRLSSEELGGFRDAMLELAERIDLERPDAIDLCGTGGDGRNTVNISTLAAFVVAGAGMAVAKHGNYGVSSVCGSSHVLEALGVRFESNPDRLRRILDRTSFCFLHAPLFHPAMKRFGPVRRELGVRTFFNLLGPLVNPAQPGYQLIGVLNHEVLRIYRHLLEETPVKYTLVTSLDGFDEMSLTSPARVVTSESEAMLHPEDLGFVRIDASDLEAGGSVDEASRKFLRVLRGEGPHAVAEAVAANAALAIRCRDARKSFADALESARESLRSGAALSVLNRVIEESRA